MATTSAGRSLAGATGLAMTDAARTRERVRRERSRLVLFYIGITLFVIFCLAPFAWTLITSLKGPDTIYHRPIEYLPNPVNLVNYQKIFRLVAFHALAAEQRDCGGRVQRQSAWLSARSAPTRWRG